ncbi:hypothetical protein CEUSTIGMA_g11349.t1 [Chlamydomonas eustigma]|uniref:Uncharacterized protein n=1 Tax=Chlamydomonas eustigma TaxID=1157962 RepID=A0A250XLE2_9CHLO|nr:hypothetical protein CEUSTIGMA_g11349.t1 [Chlamydomonas eustigma]|eukprot:GAX83925.1 hypothetical protein CEUSTIGMA_g11349.t1 [Chlamydomonas eustigma]
MSSNAVMNQAKFTAFGQECEFSLKGFIEPIMLTNNMPAVSSAQTQYDEAGSGANADANAVKIAVTGNIRVKATFTAGEICIGTGPEQKRVTLPVDWVRPSGYIDTPYLDDELRISVGGTGSIFIAVKLASKPTI